jgi:hypothetical protein
MSDQEYQYFKSFSDYTAVRLSDFFDSNLWSSTVLRACDSTIPIQRAATAVGALVFQGNPAADSNVEMLRREFAYREYAKAINLTHNSTNGGDESIRTTLIACLLFASFELFNGYPETAATQIHSGISLIGEWCAKDPKDRGSVEVEDEIIEAFRRLDFQAMAYSDSRGVAYFEGSTSSAQEGILLYFRSLQEAKISLESLMRQAMKRVSMIHPTSNQSSLMISGSLALSDPFNGTPQHSLEHAELVASFRRWEEAYGLVWDMAHKTEALHLFLGSTISRLQSLCTHLRNITKSTESLYTDELIEIMELSRKLLSHTIFIPTPEGNHSFDSNIMGSSGDWDWGNEMAGDSMGLFANSDSGEEDRQSEELDFVLENSLPRDLDWQFRDDPKLYLPSHESGFRGAWDRQDSALPWT